MFLPLDKAWETTLHGAALVTTAVGAGAALYQWRQAQRYKRAEYLDALIREFEGNPKAVLATLILDWSVRRLDAEDGTSIRWTSDDVLRALRVHSDFEGVHFPSPQDKIRDALDALLSFLQRLETAIAGGLVEERHALGYFGYWLERLRTLSEHALPGANVALRMRRYEGAYAQSALLHTLYRRAEPSFANQLDAHLCPDIGEPDIRRAEEIDVAAAIRYDDDHAKDLLSFVRARLNGATETSDTYTKTDVQAVAKFQDGCGVAVDGCIGPITRYEIDGQRSGRDAAGLWPAAGSSETAKEEHFTRIVTALGAPDVPLLLAIRGVRPYERITHAVCSVPRLDDTFVLLQKGSCHVFAGATHAYKAGIGGGLAMALIRPGAYTLVPGTADHLVVERRDRSGNIPCFRDLDGDGIFSESEMDRSRTARPGDPGIRDQANENGAYANGIWFHRNVDSIGCQTTTQDDLEIVMKAVSKNGNALPYRLVDAVDAIAAAPRAREALDDEPSRAPQYPDSPS